MDWNTRRAALAGLDGLEGAGDALCVVGRTFCGVVRCVVGFEGGVVLGALRGARDTVVGGLTGDEARGTVGPDEQPATTAMVATVARATFTWPTIAARHVSTRPAPVLSASR
jgi:hypothetical protein